MMNTVTYGQVQTLVRQIPAKKLPLAYRLLADLVAEEAISEEKQELLSKEAFLKLPLAERRRKMAEQAQELVAHYIEKIPERQDWQAGDFHDDY